MKTLDVDEFREHIGEVLRMVEKEGETIEVSNHGEVIAHLVPTRMLQSTTKTDKRDIWTDLDRLAAEISSHWPANVSAVDAVSDVRRDLL